ncbi:hypothetical protein FB451DRAFT_1379328 [Mycena latifolia]|nr:hypothetical protein FB451DRAFT_1379328 [Mycena latifolia]
MPVVVDQAPGEIFRLSPEAASSSALPNYIRLRDREPIKQATGGPRCMISLRLGIRRSEIGVPDHLENVGSNRKRSGLRQSQFGPKKNHRPSGMRSWHMQHEYPVLAKLHARTESHQKKLTTTPRRLSLCLPEDKQVSHLGQYSIILLVWEKLSFDLGAIGRMSRLSKFAHLFGLYHPTRVASSILVHAEIKYEPVKNFGSTIPVKEAVRVGCSSGECNPEYGLVGRGTKGGFVSWIRLAACGGRSSEKPTSGLTGLIGVGSPVWIPVYVSLPLLSHSQAPEILSTLSVVRLSTLRMQRYSLEKGCRLRAQPYTFLGAEIEAPVFPKLIYCRQVLAISNTAVLRGT